MISRVTNNRGVALMIVMALIIALSALTIITVDRSTTDIELSFNQQHQEQAFYIAEAGAEHALIELYKDDDWRTGIAYKEIGTGFYVVQVKDSLTDSALADTVIVQSRALVGQAVATIEVTIFKTDINPFKYSLFSAADLSMKQTVCTDSYDSDSGSYADTYDSLGADIGSNGTIKLGQDATIGGDVTSAVDGGLYLDSGNVMGDTSSGVPPEELDIIDDALFANAAASNSAPSGFSGSGYAYDPSTGNLLLNKKATLELSSGIYYFNSIDMQDSSKITVAPGASVVIFMDGNISMKHQALMNQGGAPSDYVIYSRGSVFEMYHESEFWGAFYGPQATFEAHQWIDFYGSLIAGSALLYQTLCIHYDRSLMKIGFEGKYGVVAWRET